MTTAPVQNDRALERVQCCSVPFRPPRTALLARDAAIRPSTFDTHAQDGVLRGILLVLAAMVVFSGSDAISKHLSASLPAIEIAWLRWVGFVAIMAPSIVRSRGAVLRTRALPFQALRGLALIGSTGFFVTGLHYLPLANATAV